MRLTWQPIIIALLSTAVTGPLANAAYSFDPQKDYLAPADQWPAWQNTLDRQRIEMKQIRRCDGDARNSIRDPSDASTIVCTKRYRSLNRLLKRSASLNDRQKIELVNRYVNRYRYRRDRLQKRDQKPLRNNWQTLSQFLKRGGDCEDYATAKYFILREMGFLPENLRIVVGWERANRSYHALLAVKSEQQVLFMESDNTIKRGGYQQGYRFTYSLNEEAIWDHQSGARGKGSI